MQNRLDSFVVNAKRTNDQNQKIINELIESKKQLTLELAKVQDQLIKDREMFMIIIKDLREQNSRLEARISELVKKLEHQNVVHAETIRKRDEAHVEQLRKRDEMWEHRFQLLLKEIGIKRNKRDLSEKLVTMVREQRTKLDTRGMLVKDPFVPIGRYAHGLTSVSSPIPALIAIA